MGCMMSLGFEFTGAALWPVGVCVLCVLMFQLNSPMNSVSSTEDIKPPLGLNGVMKVPAQPSGTALSLTKHICAICGDRSSGEWHCDAWEELYNKLSEFKYLKNNDVLTLIIETIIWGKTTRVQYLKRVACLLTLLVVLQLHEKMHYLKQEILIYVFFVTHDVKDGFKFL